MNEIIATIASPEAMEELAGELSAFAAPRSAILLRGDLGVGKTVFARGFIKGLSTNSELEIPSPTFTLVQTYEEIRVPVAHVDLYRLSGAAEAEELGLDELSKTHILLIEWPDRLGAYAFDDVLDVTIEAKGDSRLVRMSGAGSWATKLLRNFDINAFLDETEWKGASRRFLEGDASFRRYEMLQQPGGSTAILMDMPARPDGPPVRNGKPYSAIAHLAEDIRAVIAVNRFLCERRYSAPETMACDVQSGLAIIEDLGSKVYGRMRLAGESMLEPMRAAVQLLVDVARQEWPESVPIDGARRHVIAGYDIDAQMIEVDLLPSWFWPFLHDITVPETVNEEFARAWAGVLPLTAAERPVWVFRDYHSPNLLWLPDRQGIRRVGLIDTQDCVRGHPAYDLVSLLQDARLDISSGEETELFGYYCASRAQEAGFDPVAFEAAYAILGAQRATKILGIFARLAKRDGKLGYLQHLPRVSGYLERNLRHEVLTPVREWFARHLPASVRERRG